MAANRHNPETRDRIVEAALSLFADRGFDGTTTRQVAARAGVNLGLIQYYFGSKEKLWKDSVDRAFARLRTDLSDTIPDTPRDADQVAELIHVVTRFAARNAAFVRLMNDEGKRRGPRMRWFVDRHQRPLFEAITGVLAAARARGLVIDAEPTHLYYALLGAVTMIFALAPECRRLTGADPTADDAMVRAHAETVTRMLVARR